MNKDFSDFHTGWAIHLYYDQISGEMQKALMPPILVLSQERNYAWAYFTAIKIIEDMFSARVIQTELREELHTLTSVAIDRAPNGESLEDLRKYFADVETLYKNGPPTLEAYEALFRTYRLSEQVLTDMMTITTELMTNDTTSRRIEKIYRDTLNEFINIHLGMTRL